MNILYITQYFPPEIGATQARAYDITSYLASCGHKVTVLTEFPSHPRGILPESYRKRYIEFDHMNGIDVVRVRTCARPGKNFRNRMASYLSFMFMSFLMLIVIRGKFDIVYTTSPPLFVGLSGLIWSRIYGCKFIFEIRDLWPQTAIELDMLKNSLLIKLAQNLERLYYNKAHALIAVTRGICAILKEQGYNDIYYIPNGTNVKLFSDKGNGHKRILGLENKFVVIYAGVFGLAHGMEYLVSVVETLYHDPDIHFVFAGDGPLFDKISELKKVKSLDNLTLLPQIPRDEIPYYISAASCCLVPLKKRPLFRAALPSKIFDYMGCARPIILSVDGEAHQLIEKAKAGIYVEPENTQAMVRAILKLKNSNGLATAMGNNGRRFVTKHFCRNQQARQLEKILIGLLTAI